ncbi:hypothetical protein KJ611_00830 [Patescibacteria group bacterium]|nr:hypothetical protein [Patescibacteria group bacterium]MBU1705750.1 hypothetical protein [Patescibacteria group bacterium]
MTAILLMAHMVLAQQPVIRYESAEPMIPENTCYEIRVFSNSKEITRQAGLYSRELYGALEQGLSEFAQFNCYFALKERNEDKIKYRLEAKLYMLDFERASKLQVDAIDHLEKHTMVSEIRWLSKTQGANLGDLALIKKETKLAQVLLLQKLCRSRTCR